MHTQFWYADVSMTENSLFCMNMWELLNGKGGIEREARCLYTVPALCPVAWCSEELQYRTLICYHMNQPLQNNDPELAEASSTGVDVTWLCSCFAICECKRTMSWKTFPWKQQRSGTGAREGSGLSLFTRVGGWRGTSCAWEREQAAGCHPAPCFPPSG